MRISIATLLLLFAASGANAQTSFGVKAGLNTSTILFDDNGTFDSDAIEKRARLGFVGGVTADIPFTSSVGVRAEVLYAQKGYAIKYNFEDLQVKASGGIIGNGTVTTKLDYLEVPVLLNFMIPMESTLEIGIQAGVAPAFKLSSGFACSGFDDGDEDICDDVNGGDDGEDGFKSFDLGGALGLTVGSGPFAVDARYTMSIPTILSDSDSGDETVRNGAFSIAAIYRFGN